MELLVLKIVEDKLKNPKIAPASSAIIRENFAYLVKSSRCSKILYQLFNPCIVARDKGKVKSYQFCLSKKCLTTRVY